MPHTSHRSLRTSPSASHTTHQSPHDTYHDMVQRTWTVGVASRHKNNCGPAHGSVSAILVPTSAGARRPRRASRRQKQNTSHERTWRGVPTLSSPSLPALSRRQRTTPPSSITTTTTTTNTSSMMVTAQPRTRHGWPEWMAVDTDGDGPLSTPLPSTRRHPSAEAMACQRHPRVVPIDPTTYYLSF